MRKFILLVGVVLALVGCGSGGSAPPRDLYAGRTGDWAGQWFFYNDDDVLIDQGTASLNLQSPSLNTITYEGSFQINSSGEVWYFGFAAPQGYITKDISNGKPWKNSKSYWAISFGGAAGQPEHLIAKHAREFFTIGGVQKHGHMELDLVK